MAAACGSDADAGGVASAGSPDRLDDVVAWEREITLEENDGTINVVVRADPDPRGGFLVADEREGYIRRYAPDGMLLRQFGGRGAGPGEFDRPLRALCLADGTIAAFDGAYRGAVFDSTGERLLRTFRTPIGPLHSVTLLDDSLVLLGGRHAEGERSASARLHRWNLNRDSLEASFFSPPAPSQAHTVTSASAPWSGVDRRGDTLAVVTALSDTVYLLSMDGTTLERIPIPSARLRRLDPRGPLPDARGGVGAARSWFASFSLIADVFWVGDTFLVQYQDRTRREPDWRLLGMTRDGKRTFEAVDTPFLLAADEGTLYFVAPGSATPNVWRSARLTRR